MATKTARTSKTNLKTVTLKTSMRSMVPFKVQIDGEFVDRTAADDGDIVQIDADSADRMITKGRASEVQ